MTRTPHAIRLSVILTAAVLATASAGQADVTNVASHATLRSLAGGGVDGGTNDVSQDLGTNLSSYDGDLEVKPKAGSKKARADSRQTSTVEAIADGLVVSSQGATDIDAETSGDPLFVGAGGNVGFDVSFTLTTRATFVFSGSGFVATSGQSDSSESEVTLICTCDLEGPDCQNVDLDLDAADSPDRSTSAGGGRSGTFGPGSCTVSGGTFSSLSSVNPASRTGYSLSLVVVAGPDAVCTGPTSRWIGGDAGSFDDPNNWDPPDVPSFGGGDGQCEDALFDAGRSISVDLSAAAASTTAGVTPRAAGARHAGRLTVKRVRDAQFSGGTLTLDGQALDNGSLGISNGGGLRVVNSTTIIAHKATLGEVDGPGTLTLDSAHGFFMADLFSVGQVGDGSFVVRNGGNADTTSVSLGNAGGHGSALVDGVDSRWTTGAVTVGFDTPAELVVQNGAHVDSGNAFVDANLPPGPSPIAHGALHGPCVGLRGGAGAEIRGRPDGTPDTASEWNVGRLSIGGRGCVEVTDGALLSIDKPPGDLLVGTGETGEGALFLNDGGGVVTQHGGLVVGARGAGYLAIVENAKKASITVEGPMVIGESAGRGLVEVIGDPATDSQSLIAASLSVPHGPTANGTLSLTGGALAVVNSVDIGADADATSTGGAGQGVVVLSGIPLGGRVPLGPSQTKLKVFTALTVGPAGSLVIQDASVFVGTLPDEGTPVAGSVTIKSGGRVAGLGGLNLLLTNGGSIRNDGVVEGPVTLGGTYDGASTGRLVRTASGAPTIIATALPRLTLLDTTALASTVPALDESAIVAAAAKTAAPEGPFIVTGDADFTNTTITLQFANGFAPHQGDTFPIFDVQGQLTGTAPNVEIRGLAPGATFDLDATPGIVTALSDAIALPVVSLKAPAKLKESAKSGGKITFKRTGSTAAPLTVHYVVGGTAENGIDYATVPEELEIPAKKKSATVVVKPAADGIQEPPETITVELLAGDDYQPAVPSTATIMLLSTEKKVKAK